MKRLSLSIAIISIGLLAACNTSTHTTGILPSNENNTQSPTTPEKPEDPRLIRYKTQTLAWKSCPEDVLGDSPEAKEIYKKIGADLGNRLQCTVMTVPRDWNNPEAGNLQIELSRLTGTDKTNHQGAIFFNPGGPGANGLDLPIFLGYSWSKARPEQPLGAAFKRLNAEYDLIGFAPRGVGKLAPLICQSNERPPNFYNTSGNRSDRNINKILINGQMIARSCENNPLTPFINSDATARDMDMARHLLGEQRLNYIGFSYGTWLGDWYARLFPENTGRMLLDSNSAFHTNTLEDSFKGHPQGFERSLRRVALPYFARHHDRWGLGTDSEVLYKKLINISEPLRSIYSGMSGSFLYSSRQFPELATFTRAALELDQAIVSAPQATPYQWLAMIKQAVQVDKSTSIEPMVIEGMIISLIQQRQALLAEKGDKLGESNGTFHAIRCGDGAWNRDLSYWRKLDDQHAKDYPLFGGHQSMTPCIPWKLPSVSKPAPHKHSFLMLQGEYDAATIAEGALEAWKNTPGAHLIYVKEEPSHGLFSRGNACIDKPVLDYLLDGRLPTTRRMNCNALPFPEETTIFRTNGISSQSIKPTESSTDIFPSEAQAALEEAHRIIQKAAASSRR